MTDNVPYSIETALQSEELDPAKLPSAFFRNLANRLESALIGHSKASLVGVHAQVAELASRYFSGAARSSQDAALGAPGVSEDVRQAYSLGQVNFAQLLLSLAANKRADDEFSEILKDELIIKYLRPLLDMELTSQELSEETNTTPEHISRKLREFRALGITDFRKSGRNVINFLTPLAKDSLLEITKNSRAQGVKPSANDEQFYLVLEQLQNSRHVPLHMRQSLSFSASSKLKRDCHVGE